MPRLRVCVDQSREIDATGPQFIREAALVGAADEFIVDPELVVVQKDRPADPIRHFLQELADVGVRSEQIRQFVMRGRGRLDPLNVLDQRAAIALRFIERLRKHGEGVGVAHLDARVQREGADQRGLPAAELARIPVGDEQKAVDLALPENGKPRQGLDFSVWKTRSNPACRNL